MTTTTFLAGRVPKARRRSAISDGMSESPATADRPMSNTILLGLWWGYYWGE
ncbi:hypothetical protein DB30_03240 [Enhygromyxa salina]|uniref:Uncharacterized protein n=1 Tax=Enhygromyxa salina TaxID=215803 RepID=A0A0C1ZJ48_9BACT|nr:hypothetical protein DB30_03240 [Enhygromyxa salina]